MGTDEHLFRSRAKCLSVASTDPLMNENDSIPSPPIGRRTHLRAPYRSLNLILIILQNGAIPGGTDIPVCRVGCRRFDATEQTGMSVPRRPLGSSWSIIGMSSYLRQADPIFLVHCLLVQPAAARSALCAKIRVVTSCLRPHMLIF